MFDPKKVATLGTRPTTILIDEPEDHSNIGPVIPTRLKSSKMPPPRPYIPSSLLLRSLLRPLPRQCPLAQRIPATTIRGKKKAAHPRPKPIPDASNIDDPPDPNTLGNSGFTEIEFWDQDEHGNETFVDAIRTKEDVKRHMELHARLEAWARGDKDADEPEFRRQVIDELKKNPSFADMRDVLEKMKTPLAERMRIAEEEADALEGQDESEMDDLQQAQEFVGELLENPMLAGQKQQILEMQKKLPEWKSMNHPDFLDALAHLSEAAGGESYDDIQQKMAPLQQKCSDIIQNIAKTPEEFAENEEENLQKLSKGLKEMHELLKETGIDPELESEFGEFVEAISGEDEPVTDILDENGQIDLDKLDEANARYEAKKRAEPEPEQEDQEEYITPEERADPELKAKVDKLLEDPELFQKILLAKKLMSGALKAIQVAKPAPDPSTLSPSEMTTLQQQIKIAENDPEHLMALRRLRINMVPPYNAHPFLGPLNQALKFAYVGANDDIRRILWRAYRKARTIPGLLKAIPDDSWDLIWYSQAVDWKSNQNRRNHLSLLLGDLSSVGKIGPPNKMMGTPDEADLKAMFYKARG